MLVTIVKNKPSSPVTISNSAKEQEFLKNNPTYIQTDFKFTEDMSLYEYDGSTFSLVEDWETIKAEREAELEAQRLAQIEANKPTFEELQSKTITELHKEFDIQFDAYLARYPKAEIESFKDKANEAKAYMADNTAPTPYISSMVGGDETLRIEMINEVWAKVQYRAMLEGQMISKRDAIKACTAIEELALIEV